MSAYIPPWREATVRGEVEINGRKFSMLVTIPANSYREIEGFRDSVHRDLAHRMGAEIAVKLLAEGAITFTADIPKSIEENGV